MPAGRRPAGTWGSGTAYCTTPVVAQLIICPTPWSSEQIHRWMRAHTISLTSVPCNGHLSLCFISVLINIERWSGNYISTEIYTLCLGIGIRARAWMITTVGTRMDVPGPGASPQIDPNTPWEYCNIKACGKHMSLFDVYLSCILSWNPCIHCGVCVCVTNEPVKCDWLHEHILV